MTESNDDLDLPRPLIDALGAAHPVPPVPAHLDDQILSAARGSYRRRRQTRALVRWSLAGTSAAAAAVVLSLWISAPPANAPRPVAAGPSGDADGSGRVDILDAFAVARVLDRGGRPEPRWDVDGDGRVDRRDVDQIASAAVSLGGAAADGRTVQ